MSNLRKVSQDPSTAKEPLLDIVDEPFDLSAYQEQTQPIVFKLRGGKQLAAEFYVNYQTEANLDAFDKASADMAEGASLNDLHKAYASHLAVGLAKLVMRDNGKLVDSSTKERRFKLLRILSFQDLRDMMTQIAEKLNEDLNSAVPTFSDGLAPKAESETENPTPTAITSVP